MADKLYSIKPWVPGSYSHPHRPSVPHAYSEDITLCMRRSSFHCLLVGSSTLPSHLSVSENRPYVWVNGSSWSGHPPLNYFCSMSVHILRFLALVWSWPSQIELSCGVYSRTFTSHAKQRQEFYLARRACLSRLQEQVGSVPLPTSIDRLMYIVA